MRIVAVIFALASLAGAQESRIANGYKVQIAIQEMEAGKRIGVRNYAMQVSETKTGKLSLTTRLPVPSGSGQFNFQEVGINLTARVEEVGGQAVLESEVRLITVSEPDPRTPVSTQQFTTNVSTPVTPGRPATVTEFDDVGSKRHFLIEATVTKLK